MDTANFSSFDKCLFLTRSSPITDGEVYITTLFTCIVNSIFAITASTANSLMLYIIIKNPNLHNPANILLASLATSDLVIATVTQPAYVTYKVAELLVHPDVSCIARIIHWTFGWVCVGVSMLIITSIAVERYLALHLHLRYPAIVTSSRVLKVVVTFWVVSIAIILSLFAMESDHYWTFLPAPILVLNIVVIVTAYWKIFRILQKHRKQIRDQIALQVMGDSNASNATGNEHTAVTSHAGARTGLNMKRYRRSAMTAVYISVLQLFCYVPFFCAMVVRVTIGYSTAVKVAYECAATLVYLNSTINPVLFWYRVPDIRRAIIRFLKERKCWRRNIDSDLAPASSVAQSVGSHMRGSRVSSINIQSFENVYVRDTLK